MSAGARPALSFLVGTLLAAQTLGTLVTMMLASSLLVLALGPDWPIALSCAVFFVLGLAACSRRTTSERGSCRRGRVPDGRSGPVCGQAPRG